MADSEDARERIEAAAVAALLQGPAEGLTVAAIAEGAGCAKGLIHYHFKTKEALLARAAAAIWEGRREAWHEALRSESPADAIDRGWQALAEEAASGRVRAAVTLAARDESDLIGQSAREAAGGFRIAVTADLIHVLRGMGRTFTVPPEEAAQLFLSTINGLALDLEMGADAAVAEAAWAAFWVGLLSLTR